MVVPTTTRHCLSGTVLLSHQQSLPRATSHDRAALKQGQPLKDRLEMSLPPGINFCKPHIGASERNNEEYEGQSEWGASRKANRQDRSGQG